jgi:hypothetical protein
MVPVKAKSKALALDTYIVHFICFLVKIDGANYRTNFGSPHTSILTPNPANLMHMARECGHGQMEPGSWPELSSIDSN